jgi:hypothetical protein
VNAGTTKNTDNNSSYDNNNEEPEHLHDITTSTNGSVQPDIHSYEGGLLEQMHLISPDGPEENVKEEHSKQGYSTLCNRVTDDNTEPNMKTNKEESYMTRNLLRMLVYHKIFSQSRNYYSGGRQINKNC